MTGVPETDTSSSPKASMRPPAGHAPQRSVANAAALFGSDGDDPFASIAAAPIAEEPTQSSGQAPAPPLESTTTTTTTSAPPQSPPSLQVQNSDAAGPHFASPTKLFGDAQSNDDWLSYPAAASAEQPQAAAEGADFWSNQQPADPASQTQQAAGDHQDYFGGAPEYAGYQGQQYQQDYQQAGSEAYSQQGYDQAAPEASSAYADYSQQQNQGYGWPSEGGQQWAYDQTNAQPAAAAADPYAPAPTGDATQYSQYDPNAQDGSQYGAAQCDPNAQYAAGYDYSAQQPQQDANGQWPQNYDQQWYGSQPQQQYDQYGQQQQGQQYDQYSQDQQGQQYDQYGSGQQGQYDGQYAQQYDPSQYGYAPNDQAYNYDPNANYDPAAQSHTDANASYQTPAQDDHAAPSAHDADTAAAPTYAAQWSAVQEAHNHGGRDSVDPYNPQTASPFPSSSYDLPPHSPRYDQPHNNLAAQYQPGQGLRPNSASPAPPRSSSPYDPPSSNRDAYDAYSSRSPSPYDPPQQSYEPQATPASPAVTTSAVPPPPKGPPRGPPRKASVPIQSPPEASAAPAPALDLGESVEDPAEAPSATDGPQSHDPASEQQSQASFWEQIGDAESNTATMTEEPGFMEETTGTASTASTFEAGNDSLSAIQPPRAPPTPRLTITDEDDEERPAEIESVGGSEAEDSELDEATRDFNALGLGKKNKGRTHPSAQQESFQLQQPADAEFRSQSVAGHRGESDADDTRTPTAAAFDAEAGATIEAGGTEEASAADVEGEHSAGAEDPYGADAAGPLDPEGGHVDAGLATEDAAHTAPDGDAAAHWFGSEDEGAQASSADQVSSEHTREESGDVTLQAQYGGSYEPDAYAPSSTADGYGSQVNVASEQSSFAQDSYAPSDAYGYSPYAPQQEQGAYATEPHAGPQDPEEAAASSAAEQQQVDPYAPNAAPQANHDPYAPPKTGDQSTSSYDPYAPQHFQGNGTYGSQHGSEDAYGQYAPPPASEEAAPGDGSYQGSEQYGPGQSQGMPEYGASGYGDYGYGANGYGMGASDGGWGASTDAAEDPYGPPSGDVPDTPTAANPPPVRSPYDPPSDLPGAGLSRNKTITQKSVTSGGHARGESNQSQDKPESAYGPATPQQYGQSDDAYFGGASLSAAPSEDRYAYNGATSPYDLSRSRSASRSVSGAYSAEHAPDPIEERRGARIPVACFGIDGRFVTFFPSQSAASGNGVYGSSYGFGSDAAPPTQVAIRQLSTVIPPTSFASSFDPLQFPGPALENAGTPSSAIARATGAGAGVTASVKAKKTALIKFLKTAADEMALGISYRKRRPSIVEADGQTASPVASDPAKDAQKAEDRVLLVRLLAVVLEHDGNTTNNPAFSDAVRQLLTTKTPEPSSSIFAPGYTSTSSSLSASDPGEVLHTYEVHSSSLKQVRELLASGKRKEAVDFAVSKQLWTHAMIIASAVDQETWRGVANQFIESEMSGQADGGSNASLRLIYSLFSGQEPRVFYDLFRPQQSLSPSVGSIPASASDDAISSDKNSASTWRESASLILANRCAGDSAALTAMGDGLLVAGWQEAAHVCYLLAPQTSPTGGADAPNVRWSLLGAHNPNASTSYLRDLDHFILSEIYEFSHALVPPTKGQEPFGGLPHLQAYKLVHAYQMAELGETKRAQKYCESIASVMKACKNSPYVHRVLVSQLKELSDRLVGAPSLDSGGNWVTRKMQRPTLDGMLSAFEGRFTKFIAGDDSEQSSPSTATQIAPPNGGIGAFSHYSAITPDATTGGISRVQSYADFGTGGGLSVAGGSRPASRAASEMAFRSPAGGLAGTPPAAFSQLQQQQERSAASMGYGADYGSTDAASPYAPSGGAGYDAYSPSPGHTRNLSAGSSSVAAHSEAEGYGSQVRSYGPTDNAPWPGQNGPGSEPGAESQPQYGYGYGSDYGAGEDPNGDATVDAAGPKPQFVSNLPTDLSEAAGGSEFVSPMDAFGGPSPYAPPATANPDQHAGYAAGPGETQPRSWMDEDEDDDLGFGNRSHKKQADSAGSGAGGNADGDRQRQQEEDQKKKEAEAAKDKAEDKDKEGKKPELKPSPSTSWLSFGRLWGRRDSAGEGQPGKPVKAHMGEESAFYYDKELKRWVNKKAGDSGSAAATPPPPPRASTASPSMAGRGPAGGASPNSAPPSTLGRSSTLDGDGGSSALSNTSSPTSSPPTSYSSFPSQPGAPMSGAPAGRVPMPRARSNLGDLSQPAATQPPMRPSTALAGAGARGGPIGLGAAGPPPSSGTPPPPGASGTPPPRTGSGAAKKKPISKRYVRVD